MLAEWLDETHMDDDLAEALLDYLLARGNIPLSKLVTDSPQLWEYAAEHDSLGWQNFIEGRISTTLFSLQQDWLHEADSKLSIKTWGGTLVQHILSISHRQWSYRNATIHLKKAEGRTKEEHIAVIKEVKQAMLLDPVELLPQHQRLLEVDFGRLGSGTTEQRLVWIEEVEKALKAKRAVAGVTEQEWIDWRNGTRMEEARQISDGRRRRRRCSSPHGYNQAQSLG